MEVIKDFFTEIYTFDIVYLVFTALSLITCTKKGFLLSILSASKWLLAYVVTLFLFPKVKPLFEDIIDSKNPEIIIRKAVERMMSSNALSKKQLSNLRIFKDENHDLEAQKPEQINFANFNKKNKVN